jgi:hypothetical protein
MKEIEKKLEKLGCRLISTRFGIHGDWLVVTLDGEAIFFPTLGAVSRWIDYYMQKTSGS